jgi:hypothetical protein
MLCPWGQNDVFLGVWAWVTIVTDAASLSHLDSDRIKHVSRVGTHRSNEWEGRCGLFQCSPRCAGPVSLKAENFSQIKNNEF